jgi:hypothetical protein
MIKLNAYASLNEEQRVELALDIISFNEGNSEGLKRRNNDGNKEQGPDVTDNTVSNAGKHEKYLFFRSRITKNYTKCHCIRGA